VPPPKRRRRRDRSTDGSTDPIFERLRAARRELAAQAGVPPYVVFHDSTLRDIAAVRPQSLAELARIQGVGEAKLRRYGSAMLEAVHADEETSQ
jgi:ATP-dependent DNA helicase RecQ